jgi:hypothetical protein
LWFVYRAEFEGRAWIAEAEFVDIAARRGCVAGAEVAEVASAALRRASSVRKSMLFAPWTDAKPAQGNWTVDLPEDNPEAFKVLVSILHESFGTVPKLASLDFLCGILVVLFLILLHGHEQ